MTRERSSSGRVARRALAVFVSSLLALVGVAVAAPTAPAVAAQAAVVGARSVSVGVFHTCVVTTVGGVRCWGDNFRGQLGDGTRVTRKRPVDVVGLTSGVSQVSAGDYTTCAVTTGGAVKCWGYGLSGELGDGAFASSRTPVDVVGLTSGVASVSVGNNSVCAVTTAGAVKCWGGGALGNGSTVSSTVPVDVVGLTSGVRAVAVGVSFACATTATGVSCWGSNNVGQLGIGKLPSTTTPVAVLGLGADVSSISASSYTACATTAGGQARCWGANTSGYLGVGSTAHNVWRPMKVSGVSGASSVSARWVGGCALGRHLIWCWGYNDSGGLGDGTTTSRPTSAPVSDLTGPFSSLAAGTYHACAVKQSGRVFCWGANLAGELGNGTLTDATTPVPVSGLNG